MTNESVQSNITDQSWEHVRTVWSEAGIDLPKTPDEVTVLYLSDLKVVVGTYRAAKSVSETDRNRTWSANDLADQCRDLAQALYQVDGVMFSRAAGSSLSPVAQILPETISNLHGLESAFRNAPTPRIPRKKKHEHNNFLISLLADVYERRTCKAATTTTDNYNEIITGPFVQFVFCFVELFLGGEVEHLTPRVIKDALTMRRKIPDPMAE
jgi:hypothetical protein